MSTLNKIKKEIKEFVPNIRSLPTILVVLYCVTIVVMNLLANKTIFQNDLIAIDGGVVITWLVIVIADLVVLTKGPKNAIRLAIFGIFVNLIVSLIFFLVSLIPSSSNFDEFKRVLGGNWFILLSSTVAFLCSSSLNAIINFSIGKAFKNNSDSKVAYCLRCYVSTVISAFIDNLIFSCLCYMLFAPIFWNGFSWTFIQCLMCALVYAGIELVIETLVTPFTYHIFKRLKQ